VPAYRSFGLLLVALVMVGVAMPSASNAAADPAARTDDLVNQFAALPNVPSVAVGVYSHGRVVYLRALGYRDIEKKLPADTQTLYDTASMGKQFTAAATLMLVERGKIKRDALLSTYLPTMPNAGKVTVDQLMHMTAGYANLQQSIPEKGDAIAQIEYYAGQPMLFAPGSKYSYSNTNYEILGALIQKVTGKPYDVAMRDLLFGPLGMTSWRMLAPEPDLPNRAVGYVFPTPMKWYIDESSQHPTTLGASGSFRLDVADMMKWDADLFAHRVVSAQVWDAMSTPGRLDDGTTIFYAGGETVGDFNGHKVVLHSGGHNDVVTWNWIFPNDDLAIAVFVNAGWAASDELARAIAGMYLGIPNPKPYTLAGGGAVPSAAIAAGAHTWLENAFAGTAALPDPDLKPWLADYMATRQKYGAPTAFTPEFSQEELTLYHVTLGSTLFTFAYATPPGFGVALLPSFVPK
jgi:CubicO group peptidase (beta-lactamase class C family)